MWYLISTQGNTWNIIIPDTQIPGTMPLTKPDTLLGQEKSSLGKIHDWIFKREL